MLTIQSLTDQVYEHLLGLIVAGELVPGTPLREADLAAQLGVSRTPIREALGRLIEYGVVEGRPNHGVLVRRLGREEVTHFYQVREALEGMAATLACGRLDAEDFARLDALAASSRDSHTPGAFDAFDVGLHRLIAERTGNPILAREIRKLLDLTMLIHDQVEGCLLDGERIAEDEPAAIRRHTWSQHVAIVEALRAGDAARCEEAMIAHLRAACAYKVELMADGGPAGAGPAAARPTPPSPPIAGRRAPGPGRGAPIDPAPSSST